MYSYAYIHDTCVYLYTYRSIAELALGGLLLVLVVDGGGSGEGPGISRGERSPTAEYDAGNGGTVAVVIPVGLRVFHSG